MPNNPDNSELPRRRRRRLHRHHRLQAQALEAIARAPDQHRSRILTHARYNREADTNAVIVNPANVVSVGVSSKDSVATGQYL